MREEEAKMNGEEREEEGLRERSDRSCNGIPVEQDALEQELLQSREKLKVSRRGGGEQMLCYSAPKAVLNMLKSCSLNYYYYY